MTEFGRVCERRKLRVNVGKSKVMRCSRQVNVGRMNVRLNGDQFRGSGVFQVPGFASGSRWRM